MQMQNLLVDNHECAPRAALHVTWSLHKSHWHAETVRGMLRVWSGGISEEWSWGLTDYVVTVLIQLRLLSAAEIVTGVGLDFVPHGVCFSVATKSHL